MIKIGRTDINNYNIEDNTKTLYFTEVTYNSSRIYFSFSRREIELPTTQLAFQLHKFFFMLNIMYREYQEGIQSRLEGNTEVLQVMGDLGFTIVLEQGAHDVFKIRDNESNITFKLDFSQVEKIITMLYAATNKKKLFSSQIRKHIMDNMNKGIDCPVCDSKCKLYKRKFNRNMLESLTILIAEFDGINLVHTNEIVNAMLSQGSTIGETSRLSLWKLATRYDKDGGLNPHGSYLKPTPLGYDFVKGLVEIPAYVHLYKNVIQGHSKKKVKVDMAKGIKFNLQELMSE